MDTILAVVIVLAAAAGIARSVWRRIARRSEASCASGCDGCALASRCGAATASGAPPRPTSAPSSPSETGIARP
ncbi:MAG: FeoB-associated Cys-rich membrane protein [Thermoanaerobaculia bacterium]